MPQKINGDRVLLSTTEAMQQSNLSREHIQRLLRTGRIEGIKLGHDWLVFEDALKMFLAQPRKTGPKGSRKIPNNAEFTSQEPVNNEQVKLQEQAKAEKSTEQS